MYRSIKLLANIGASVADCYQHILAIARQNVVSQYRLHRSVLLCYGTKLHHFRVSKNEEYKLIDDLLGKTDSGIFYTDQLTLLRSNTNPRNQFVICINIFILF